MLYLSVVYWQVCFIIISLSIYLSRFLFPWFNVGKLSVFIVVSSYSIYSSLCFRLNWLLINSFRTNCVFCLPSEQKVRIELLDYFFSNNLTAFFFLFESHFDSKYMHKKSIISDVSQETATKKTVIVIYLGLTI